MTAVENKKAKTTVNHAGGTEKEREKKTMNLILTIGQLCAFGIHFISTPENKLIIEKASHDKCVSRYQSCMDVKRKQSWKWRDEELTDMLWQCMKEIRNQ